MEGESCEVWPDNWEALTVFVRLATQWRVVAGMAGALHLGLDYCAIAPTLRLMGVARGRWPAIFDALRVMEAAALPLLNERSARPA